MRWRKNGPHAKKKKSESRLQTGSRGSCSAEADRVGIVSEKRGVPVKPRVRYSDDLAMTCDASLPHYMLHPGNASLYDSGRSRIVGLVHRALLQPDDFFAPCKVSYTFCQAPSRYSDRYSCSTTPFNYCKRNSSAGYSSTRVDGSAPFRHQRIDVASCCCNDGVQRD
jgi:hypothetical protein